VSRYVARSAALLVLALLFAGRDVSAQTASTPSIRWIEIELGGGLLGGAPLGTADANLRANERTAQPYRLFTADHRFEKTGQFHLRASRLFGARWGVEGGLAIGHPVLRADVSADIEGAPALAISETVDQYFFDAALVVAFEEFRLGRLVPFATGGAGYLRQLHEGQTVIEHGHLFQAGAGVRYPFLSRASGLVRAAGLRGDVRGYVLRGGVSVNDRPRPHIAISGGVFVGF
jgi:hypothetical protein